MDLLLRLSRRGQLQADLYRELREAILDGRLRPGEVLPASRALARELRVSRNTVLHAYDQLSAEGFLHGRAGAGTRVRDDVPVHHRPRAPQGRALRPRPVFGSLRLALEEKTSSRWDFRIGTPDLTLFPADEWRRLVGRQLRRRRHSLQSLPPEGDPGAREAIAHWIGQSRSVHAAADDVLITSGAQQAIDLVARVLIEPGATVAMEDPGYPPARELFRIHGAKVVPVPVDAEGLVVEKLPGDARLVYVTPSHQFPLGVAMSLARRQALLAWSERTGAAILEDDYDSEFRFDGRPLEPLQSLDRNGRVVYVGSFSKVLHPNLRLGFLVAPASLMPALQLAKVRTDWHGAPEPQRALSELIRDGLFARHLRRVRRIYAERHERLRAAIERHLGDRVLPYRSAAGLHLAFELSDRKTDLAALLRHAKQSQVLVEALPSYFERAPRPGLGLGYGRVDAADIEPGIRKLASFLR